MYRYVVVIMYASCYVGCYISIDGNSVFMYFVVMCMSRGLHRGFE